MLATQFARLQFCAERNNSTQFIAMQKQYNLLYREEEREMNPFCNETGGFGASERSALEEGAISKAMVSASGLPGLDEADPAIVKCVMETADEKRWPMGHVALAWILRRVASPIIGLSSVQRMDEANAAVGKMLSAEEEESLEALYWPKAYLVAESL
ncbi:NADP-dependent oxidoreductase domain-containing protein [Aspergillus germanicus]